MHTTINLTAKKTMFFIIQTNYQNKYYIMSSKNYRKKYNTYHYIHNFF